MIGQARQRRTFHFVVKWQSGRASGEDLMGDHRSRKALMNSLLGGLSSFEGSHKGQGNTDIELVTLTMIKYLKQVKSLLYEARK